MTMAWITVCQCHEYPDIFLALTCANEALPLLLFHSSTKLWSKDSKGKTKSCFMVVPIHRLKLESQIRKLLTNCLTAVLLTFTRVNIELKGEFRYQG